MGLAAVLVFAGAAAGDSGAPLFSGPRLVAEVSGVGGMTELQTGDLNGDGVADAVVTRLTYPPAYETHPIGLFLADGTGGFTDGSSLFSGPVPRTEHGRQILIADFNGDHRNDIFVADHGYDADPWPGYPNTLALSTPDGKLVDASGNLPPESGFSHSATTADIDGDGDLDIFVGNLCCTPPPEILLNDGTGHFTLATGRLPADVTASNSYTRSLFVDVNKDGSPDLVLGANGDATDASRVLLNDGHGTFHDGTPLPAKPWGATAILISIATLDVNADGYPDLLAGFTQSNPFYVGRRIQVLVNAGDGTFRDETVTRLPQQSDGSSWPHDIRVADMNGDGHTDFGVAPNWPDRPTLYLDDGTGVFHLQDLPQTESEFAFVDANRDARTDLFSSFPGGSTSSERHFVQLQISASPPPPPPAPPPPPVLVPKSPTGVRASHGLRGRITVRWRAAAGATRYEIWRARPHHRRIRIGRTAATRSDDRRVRHGVTYTYWIRAGNSAGMSTFSAPVKGRRR